MDFGWDHPQAFAKLAWNREDNEIYVTNVWKASKSSADDAWGATKSWAAGLPVAWPHDGLQHEKGRHNSVQQKVHYANAGFKMMAEHATHPPVTDEKGQQQSGGVSVEHGLYEMYDLMRKGKFKVFSNCRPFFEEFVQYHRDEKGNIVKLFDDILSAVRYAYMMRRFFIPKGDIIGGKKPVYIPKPVQRIGR